MAEGKRTRGNRDGRFEDLDQIVEDEDHNGWAVAYGDVISVLLTFLFLILSISEINPRKFEEIKNQTKNIESPIDVDKIYKELKRLVEEKNLEDLVSIEKTGLGVNVNISDKLLFPSGKANIQRDNLPVLTDIVNTFKELPDQYRFGIEGHSDDVPIKNEEFPSNWHLSATRAISVLKLFENQGFSHKRFSVEGKADTKPLVDIYNKNGKLIPENREKNRRVLIRVF